MKTFKGTNQTWHLNGLNGIQSASGTIVAIATNDGILSKETVKANAKLIAAAPELLEALQSIVGIFDEENLTNGDVEKIRKAESAINKALNI